MAKPVPVTAEDLTPSPAAQPKAAVRQRGVVPSSELVPLQFRMPPDFVRAFKRAALDRDMKLNEFLNYCFQQIHAKFSIRCEGLAPRRRTEAAALLASGETVQKVKIGLLVDQI